MNATVIHPRAGVFFTSDLHLFHDKPAKDRGFPDSASHDAFVVDTWRQHVAESAVVWVLGDLTGGGHLPYALELLLALPGRKRLVLGNHDKGHPLHDDAHRYGSAYARVFEWVGTAAKVRIDGRKVMLSHFPYVGDSAPEDRHTAWRLRDVGRPLLHGHTHQGLASLANDNVIHVGWDTWHRPVHRDEIAALIH